MAAIARCVGCAIPIPPQMAAEWPNRELRWPCPPMCYRASPLPAPPSGPQASDDWSESSVGLSWRRAVGLYPKTTRMGRGVLMAELDREARSLEPCGVAAGPQRRRSEPLAQLVRRLIAVSATGLCHGALCAGYGAALRRSGQAAARRHRLA